jgi:hypothetical protein
LETLTTNNDTPAFGNNVSKSDTHFDGKQRLWSSPHWYVDFNGDRGFQTSQGLAGSVLPHIFQTQEKSRQSHRKVIQ